jgi:hypothetical protein
MIQHFYFPGKQALCVNVGNFEDLRPQSLSPDRVVRAIKRDNRWGGLMLVGTC